jgi:hypothetical protein
MHSAAVMIGQEAPSVVASGETADDPVRSESSATGARTALAVDPDALEELADEIVVLSAHIHAATHRLLVLIAQYDRLRGWELCGHRTCAHWLAARTGIDLGAAREKVRAARALERLPLTGEAMARGELSFSQVRALTRVSRPESEADLLQLARGATTAQLERMIRAWKRCGRKEEAELERERIQARSFSIFPDYDGMYVVRGRLTPEIGALLMRAIEAAGDALFHAERSSAVESSDANTQPGTGANASDDARAAAQRRADAVALLAERALAAGFEAGRSGTCAERYQVVLHVDAATLSEHGDPGRSELDDGTRVSAETLRRLACDSSVVRVATRSGGGARGSGDAGDAGGADVVGGAGDARSAQRSVLDVGRRTRTVAPALRRALEIRDRGCRFPGCGSRFTDAHHVRHWADGGETGLANCLLLCAHHHRLVHEGGWRVAWWGEVPVFRDPRGHEHVEGGWRAPPLGHEPVQQLIAEQHRRGVVPDPMRLGARWRREAEIPAELCFHASHAVQRR